MNKSISWTPVAVFIALALGLAWLVALPLWFTGGLSNPLFALFSAVMMFTPLTAAVFVSLVIEKRALRSLPDLFGLSIRKPIRRTLLWSIGALFGTELLIFAGIGLVVALGLVRIDLVGFSGFADMLRASSPRAGELPVVPLAILQIIAIPIGAVFNCLVTVGEEVGWRGWLLPTLRPLGTGRALVLTGIVWGVWHAPLILIGFNFAQPNGFGLLLMVVGCVLFGTLLGWMRLRSNSLWPSMIGHGAFNAAGSTLVLIAASGESPDPVLTGPLGVCAWIPMLIVIAALILRRQFRTPPLEVEFPEIAASGRG